MHDAAIVSFDGEKYAGLRQAGAAAGVWSNNWDFTIPRWAHTEHDAL